MSRLTGSILLVVALGACSLGTDEAQVADPGVQHVHALVSDPDDPGVLLAAAHTGLFRLDDRGIERVSESWHDLMALALSSDGSLLASGHPAMDADHLRVEGEPPHLGLVRSFDEGRTWEPISLLGEADFHALIVTEGEILGAEATSGTLLASPDDGASWERRSQIDLLSLVQHPSDAELLVGATQRTLMRSDDTGRTWSPIDPEPGPVAATSVGFVAAATDGTVTTSLDGADWHPVGQLPSAPQALHADGATVFAWTIEHGLQASEDEGRTWRSVHSVDP